jgi:hypothetical protein
MSFPTTPAFIVRGDFSHESAVHPAMKFMEDYREDFDFKRDFSPKWYTSDFTYVPTNGQPIEGRDAAFKALMEFYSMLKATYHEPIYMSVSETDFGYAMVGLARMWVDLPGDAAAEEPKREDKNGRKWDLACPGGYVFHFVPHGDSFLIKRIEVAADTAPISMGMVKRGVISAKDLGF